MSGSFDFVLGSVEASVIGQALGVDVRRFPLRFRNTTTDPVRLVKLTTLVSGELAKRRLLVGGKLHPQVSTAFELFSSQRVVVSISGIDGRGCEIAVLALTDGAQALGITQHGGVDELLFSLFSDDDLVDILAGVLPVMGRAPGPEATVRQSATEYRSALTARRAAERAHDEEETSAFGNIEVVGMVNPPRKSRGSGETDHERLSRVLAGERLGGGQIVVTGLGERSTPLSLSWLDTGEGRYLVHTTEARGEFVARYEPADHADVAHAIRELVSQAY
ncbi:ESX secretion-associated protein EspG [Prauserella oleivorans]|uniref:ESX secretion-associated protein EspG n=1 Tax=Prauserella oleivorans TaxID=1478153 RepID=A0ABW5WHC5_9PSEU